MAYCTIADIQAAMDARDLVRYTDDSDAGAADQGKITAAITGAGAIIDSHICGRYGAGLSPVPDLIKDLAVDISIYRISSRRADAPEEFRKRYEDAISRLKRIASGDTDIPGIEIDEDTGTTDGAAAVVSQKPVFSGPGRCQIYGPLPWEY
ncbi:gp436 family protein [Desulfobacter vibrioformis]|uniref:gp436 family protein n=1 Tax=Desulfobacter vibrioformis TaxID=34031 RepID=UPI0012EC1414|nr:DUF1320 domain-containing protein [Desulfobacter vibrioformis]